MVLKAKSHMCLKLLAVTDRQGLVARPQNNVTLSDRPGFSGFGV